ncbi:MAG: ABC transporter permease [Anaerolineae bacterium]
MPVLLSIARKELRHLLRDPWSLTIVTLGAVVLLGLLAYTFSLEVSDVPTVVWDAGKGPGSRAYLDSLRRDDFFALHAGAGNEAEIARAVTSGQARVGLILPPDFDRRLAAGQPVTLQAIVDGTAPNEAIRALGHIEALTADFSARTLARDLQRRGMLAGNLALPLDLRVRVRYNPALRTVNGILPGLMAIVLAMPALSAAVALAREKELGTLEGLLATPVHQWQIVAGKLAPYLLVGLIDTWLFAIFGKVGFGVPFQGTWPALLLLATTFLVANLGIALFISSLARTQQAATVIAFVFFILPSFFLSGFYFPRFSMPDWLQAETYLLPATHFVIIARGVLLKGVGLETLWPNGAFLTGAGAVMLGLAVLRMGKRLG